jgi:divalent metal cation (Fe/Co/Zn/Cd) transporter
MLCDFPDLYDYDYDSTGGAGDFSLMGYGGYGTNPTQVDAYNSLKDGAASFVVIVALILSSLGFHYFDAIGGMVVSVMILAVAYVSIRESSIVLMDGCICGDILEDIYGAAEGVPGVRKLRNLRLRQVGRGPLSRQRWRSMAGSL